MILSVEDPSCRCRASWIRFIRVQRSLSPTQASPSASRRCLLKGNGTKARRCCRVFFPPHSSTRSGRDPGNGEKTAAFRRGFVVFSASSEAKRQREPEFRCRSLRSRLEMTCFCSYFTQRPTSTVGLPIKRRDRQVLHTRRTAFPAL